MTTEDIKIEGYIGKWYIIDTMENPKLYLLEHSTWGDYSPCLIVDENYNVVLDTVYNGFDDYFESIDE